MISIPRTNATKIRSFSSFLTYICENVTQRAARDFLIETSRSVGPQRMSSLCLGRSLNVSFTVMSEHSCSLSEIRHTSPIPIRLN
jgi:hypothetical protein